MEHVTMSAPDNLYQSNSGTIQPDSGDDTPLTETAKTDLADLGAEVSQQAAALGEEAKAQVDELAEKAKGMAGEQKDLLAKQLGGVSDALQKVAGELETNSETSAHYVRMVADGAQRLTGTLRDNSVDDILGIAQDFGRKQPAAFLGLAALLGFAASRFVSASAQRPQTNGSATSTSAERPAYANVSGGSTGGGDARI
jgi:hypothetical protein